MNERKEKKKLLIWLFSFLAVVSVIWMFTNEAKALTVQRTFDWATSTQDWTETGTGNYSTLLGNPAGAFINRRDICPVKCESFIRWTGTWSDLFQIYEPFYIVEILGSLGNVDYSYNPSSGDKRHSFEIWDENEHVLLAEIIKDHLHCNDEGVDCRSGSFFFGEAEACDPQTCLPGANISYINLVGYGDWDDKITLKIENSIENYTGLFPAELIADSPIIKASIASTTFHFSWLVPTAFANTVCEFVTTGATTTADCTDPRVRNQTQDIFNTTVMFIVVLVIVMISLEKLHNRRQKFKD